MEKTKETCLICNRVFESQNSLLSLSKHIKLSHKISSKDYYDKFLKKPGEGFCEYCNKETPFRNIRIGYSKYCSNECSPFFNRESYKKYMMENFGVENYVETDEFKEKSKKTLLKNFGVDHQMRSEVVKNKAKQTNLKKIGAEHNWKNGSSTREKMKRDCLNLLGVEYPLQSQVVRDQCSNTYEERTGYRQPLKNKEDWNKTFESRLKNIKSFEEKGYIKLKDVVEEYGSRWIKNINVDIVSQSGCLFLHSSDLDKVQIYAQSTSCYKSSLEEDVSTHLLSLNVEITNNSRKTIPPLEIDIFNPKKMVAIECNGIYWHSVNAGTSANYHLTKTKLCEENGIRLIHINEWEWENKQDICKSIISGALGVYQERIYARKCEIREVHPKEARQFLELNHIQGWAQSKVNLGLYYNDELVQIVTLGKSRFKKGETELIRMCSKLNTQVIGGFSKLIKHLPDEMTEIYSYVDRSKFNGKGYFSTGWELVSETEPNYHYYTTKERLTRNQCQKYKLKELLGEDNFNENLTETENMINNKYLKVYDSGNLKVKYKRD